MKGLTERQEAVYRFIVEYRGEHQISPSYQDICDQFAIKSRQGAARHVDALIKKGYIRKSFNIARSIVPVH